MSERGRQPEATATGKTTEYISNDSSLGGEEFYDAVEDGSVKQREQSTSSVGGVSSTSRFGSNNSRARSSSVATLVPTPAAAELMAALASSDSSNLDLSSFGTAGDFETRGSIAVDEGEPGGSLGLGFYQDTRSSRNPFVVDEATDGANGGGNSSRNGSKPANEAGDMHGSGFSERRRWPPKMVVTDISSAETTPVPTPSHTPVTSNDNVSSLYSAGGGGVRQTALWATGRTHSPSPLPMSRLPPQKDHAAAYATRNPFAAEAAAIATATATAGGSPVSSVNTNPFDTAFSEIPLSSNPFAIDPTEEENCDGEEDIFLSVRAQVAAASISVVASMGENKKTKPPPLPPRRPVSPADIPRATSRATTGGEGGGSGSSGPASPKSAISSTTCDSSSGGGRGDLESSGAMDTTSIGSSGGSDATTGSTDKKYMVVNKDTGQEFDLRKLENNFPANNYALLPSRKDLMELERRRSVIGIDTAVKPTVAKSRSTSPSSRPTLSATVTASVAAAVERTGSSRREKAKHLGSMMRKTFGKVTRAAGAPDATGGLILSSSGRGTTGGGDSAAPTAAAGVVEREAGQAPIKAASPGGAGDRTSGGIGAAARVVSGALAGIRVSFKGKDSSETLSGLMLFQELQCHDGPIWAAAFNHSGQFLATAGQDARILLHRVGDVRDEIGDGNSGDGGGNEDGATAQSSYPAAATSAATSVSAGKTGKAANAKTTKNSSAFAGRSACPDEGERTHGNSAVQGDGSEQPTCETTNDTEIKAAGGGENGHNSERRAAATVLIDTTPWQILEAHRGDVVALAWSRNDFLLSASIDRTVRLWHTTQGHCLHFFQHAETVSSVDFHPCFEHFFLSGCFDKKIRVWNIRDGRVQEWQQAPDMVTAAKFSLDGRMIVAGLYMGQVMFYQTEGMRYFTQIECRNRRGMKKRGRKVTGFAFKKTSFESEDSGNDKADGSVKDYVAGSGGDTHPPSPASSAVVGQPDGSRVSINASNNPKVGGGGRGGGGVRAHIPEQLLVTTNDSRLRLYNTDDFGMNAKYKGFSNDTLQITASFSEDGKQIISGSENGKVYVWSTGVFARPSPSTLPGTPAAGVAPPSTLPLATSAAAAAVAASAPPTHKDTNRCYESFQATSEAPRIVTTASFVPESTTRACVTAVRGGLSKDVDTSGGYCGCMILATDYNGVIRVYVKSSVLLS